MKAWRTDGVVIARYQIFWNFNAFYIRLHFKLHIIKLSFYTLIEGICCISFTPFIYKTIRNWLKFYYKGAFCKIIKVVQKVQVLGCSSCWIIDMLIRKWTPVTHIKQTFITFMYCWWIISLLASTFHIFMISFICLAANHDRIALQEYLVYYFTETCCFQMKLRNLNWIWSVKHYKDLHMRYLPKF